MTTDITLQSHHLRDPSQREKIIIQGLFINAFKYLINSFETPKSVNMCITRILKLIDISGVILATPQIKINRYLSPEIQVQILIEDLARKVSHV